VIVEAVPHAQPLGPAHEIILSVVFEPKGILNRDIFYLRALAISALSVLVQNLPLLSKVMADPLTITAGLVSAITTINKMARAFKPSAADSKSRARLIQLMETVTAINAILASLPDLPAIQSEHLQKFTKEIEVEMSDISKEMERLLEKRDDGISSSLKMPWVRRDLDKLQKRLDLLHYKVAQEFDEAHRDTQQ
jgi:hypothetical protein